MRAFIVLCLVAIASADKLGYNYQPVGHSDAGLSFSPGAASNVAPLYAAPSQAAATYAAPAAAAPSYAAPVAAPTAAEPAYAAPVGELEKEFYTYSANDGDFNEPISADQIANSLKKNLRVVFIKGPEHNAVEDAALALAKQAGQQQTAIYVLNKQTDIGDLANRLNSLGGNNNAKPEVHFVKYRTPEDAANAQHAIQSQYDSLPGSSQSHHGGVAPVLNFASQASAPAPAAAPSAPQQSYLPASIFRTI